MNGEKTAILIAGATASGKSAAALELAQALDGVVINTDSMQVYRDLRILTARPSPQEEAAAPHVLYGHVDAAERYSVGRWLTDARQAAEEAWAAGRVPIFTGGTGLYFRALEQGLADVPAVPEAVHAQVAALAEQGGVAALREEAARRGMRRVPEDRQRLVRALEVFLATGRELHTFHGTEEPVLGGKGVRLSRVFIAPDRAWLRERIAKRFHAMLETGAVEEVRALLARGLDASLPAMKAHGVRNIAAALRGEIGMKEAAEGAINETRQYAKRQMTWARRFMGDWAWVEDAEEAVRQVLACGKGLKNDHAR